MPLNCVIPGHKNRGFPHHGQDATVAFTERFPYIKVHMKEFPFFH